MNRNPSVIRTRPSCAGLFRMVMHKADVDGNPIPGTARVVADWFSNLITDQGLERMGTDSGYFNYCHIGTSNTTPAFADTALGGFLAASNTIPTSPTNAAQATPPYYASTTGTYRFGAGVGTGIIAEVGTAWAASGATLFSHALILDGGGSPTTIAKLADEILDVTYQFRVYPPTADVTGTINISGTDYDYIIRAAGVSTFSATFGGGWGTGFGGTKPSLKGTPSGHSAYTGTLGAVTGVPSGTTLQADGAFDIAYVGGSHYLDGRLVWDVDSVFSVRSVTVNFFNAMYQVQFSPPIPKTAPEELRLVFRNSWARAVIP